MKSLKTGIAVLIFIIGAFLINGCNKNNATDPNANISDDEYLQNVVTNGYSSGSDEDNVMTREHTDLDNGGAVYDDDNNPGDNPIDSLKRWGRKITNVNINYSISGDDSIKTVLVTRTISGVYIIRGWSGGSFDSINKPYTEVLKRNIVFKRVARFANPRLNWRVYQISNVDGGTTSPQVGSSQVQITKVEVYVSGQMTPKYVFNGPDFQNQLYTTILFGGTGIPSFVRGEHITVNIFTISQQQPVDYVAFHWARNSFGFHRIPFTLLSQTGNNRIYTKNFTIYQNHPLGVFNAYFSANTHESLYDDDISKFASDFVGIPYKVLQ